VSLCFPDFGDFSTRRTARIWREGEREREREPDVVERRDVQQERKPIVLGER